MKANISELFSGIQGEGPLIGQRQVFLRFNGCDLRCQWCDTPASLVSKPSEQFAKLERQPGKRDFEEIENQIDLNFLAKRISSFEQNHLHHSMSLTGGEPLLQVNFIEALLKKLKTEFNFKPQIYLETGGHRTSELKKIIDLVDYISFDLKLPSSTGERELWNEHLEFIQVAKSKNGYGKAVLTSETDVSEVERCCEILRDTQFELVLQPAYPGLGSKNYSSPSPEQMLKFQERAINSLGRGRVRVIPQTHKFIGQL